MRYTMDRQPNSHLALIKQTSSRRLVLHCSSATVWETLPYRFHDSSIQCMFSTSEYPAKYPCCKKKIIANIYILCTHLEIGSVADRSILGRRVGIGQVRSASGWILVVSRSRGSVAFRTRRTSRLTRGFPSRTSRVSTAESRLLRDWLLVAVATAVVNHQVLKHAEQPNHFI